MLPPLFWRRFFLASASSIDHSLVNICMLNPPHSPQDSAANAWKKEIFFQMNMFLFDCCFRHLLTPPSMPIHSLTTVSSPRRYSNSKALVIRFTKIYHLSSTILDLQYQWPLRDRSLLLFRLVTKVFMIHLSRYHKSKSLKNLFMTAMTMKSHSNDSSMTNTLKLISTPRQSTINSWNTRISTNDSR